MICHCCYKSLKNWAKGGGGRRWKWEWKAWHLSASRTRILVPRFPVLSRVSVASRTAAKENAKKSKPTAEKMWIDLQEELSERVNTIDYADMLLLLLMLLSMSHHWLHHWRICRVQPTLDFSYDERQAWPGVGTAPSRTAPHTELIKTRDYASWMML